MLIPTLYLLLIAAAESITVWVNPQVGVLMHVCLLLALILHGAITGKVLLRRFLLVMTLVPLIRILSTTLPLAGRPLLEWHIVIGALLFVAIFFTFRAVQLDRKRVGLHFDRWPWQLMLGLVGVPLGYIEYQILQPAALISSWSIVSFIDASFVLLIFTGLLEEIIFRGLMQEVTMEIMGIGGIFYTAGIFAVLHLGYKSLPDLLFVYGVALLFGWIVYTTRSLLAVTLAHGVINIFLYLLLPLAAMGTIHFPVFVIGTPVFSTEISRGQPGPLEAHRIPGIAEAAHPPSPILAAGYSWWQGPQRKDFVRVTGYPGWRQAGERRPQGFKARLADMSRSVKGWPYRERPALFC
jgi:membrane protease YdiL (CAAX protease family)